MDATRFDDLARALGARVPRRALGGIIATVFTIFGVGAAEGTARRKAKRRHERRQDDARGELRDHRRDREKAEDRDGGSEKKPPPLHADGKKKPKKKPKCVGAGGSCKKPKKGKAKKCCAGLACDSTTTRCVAEENGNGGGGGGEACETCAQECHTCDLDAESCTARCGGADCAAVDRACAAVAKNGSHHTTLSGYLVGLGYVPSGPSRITLAREAGAVVASELMATFAMQGGGGTAELRTVVNPAGEAMSAALLVDGDVVGEALFVDEDRQVQRLERDRTGNERASAEARVTVRAATEESAGCWWCKKTCAWGGVQSACAIAGTLCAVRNVPGPWGKAINFAACVLFFGNLCQEAGNLSCESLCRGVCDTCGGACSYDKCETCQNGSCVGCLQDVEYCQRLSIDRTINFNCSSCPSCEGECAVISAPEDTAQGTDPCPTRFCDGTCPQGLNYRCVGSACVCTAKTCAELGRECDVWDNGCGSMIDCGGCATEERPQATCDVTGACVCHWDGWCHGDCGPEPDGCGGTVDCGRCDSPSTPKAYCGEDRQCHCEPDTCASLGTACGYDTDGCGRTLDCGNHDLLCGRNRDICCAEGQTCCGLDWEDSACCDWSACHKWPGGKPKGCCPDIQQCVNKGGSQACCPEGWRCRGGGDPSHPTENCCVMSGQGHEALHGDPTLCCSGELATMFPHSCV